ncbi:hypothetical protein VTO73DRAFT_2520 [Trametes versicolor]
MPKEQEIVGSAGIDFAMLERNLLSHLRLAVLLSLLSSSLLLHTRLLTPSDPGSAQTPASKTGLATAIIEVIAAVAAIAAEQEDASARRSGQTAAGSSSPTRTAQCSPTSTTSVASSSASGPYARPRVRRLSRGPAHGMYRGPMDVDERDAGC